ncbi:MAG TPA: ABC transporter ATP-binding protein [Candidatus Limnocylindria bacterium]|jgi:ABC-2 type transport system ATP-binding protein|nr:ABC transporter ATP-binding protein [Candidatus Limnocylindria bacterium]
MLVISVHGLERRFRTVTAVYDLSFNVPAGAVYGLLGPNGAGKTTTIRMLAGLIAPTAGTAEIAGHPLGPDNAAIRAMTGILTESPGLHDRLTARQNLAYYGRLYGLTDGPLREAVDRYLDIVGLTEAADRRVGGFSKGMRQRVAVARALLHEPRVIYLDEPTSGLDPEAAKSIRALIASLREEGRSILLCTHNLDEAERLCDQIGILNGHLLAEGSPAELRRHGRPTTTRIELDGGPVDPAALAATVRALPFVTAVTSGAADLTVELAEPRQDTPDLVRELIQQGARVVAVSENVASLEQVYLDLVGERADRDAEGVHAA